MFPLYLVGTTKIRWEINLKSTSVPTKPGMEHYRKYGSKVE